MDSVFCHCDQHAKQHIQTSDPVYSQEIKLFQCILEWQMPIHVLFHLQATGLTPAMGHVGYHKWMKKDGTGASIGQRYFHYLHHRYFECNYGGDGTVPLDKWFGTWHDGTLESHREMRAKRKETHGI